MLLISSLMGLLVFGHDAQKRLHEKRPTWTSKHPVSRTYSICVEIARSVVPREESQDIATGRDPVVCN